jgi:hypothetical protein
MDQEIEQLIADSFSKLPKELQKGIAALPLSQIAQDIANKNKLHIDQSGSIYTETLLTLIGIETTADISKNIQSEVGVNEDVAKNITNELNERVFKALKINLQQESAQPKPDLGSKLSSQAMAYPPKSPQPLMTPRSTFSANPPKPFVTNGNVISKPVAPLGVVPPKPAVPLGVIPPKPTTPAPQIPAKPSFQANMAPKPQATFVTGYSNTSAGNQIPVRPAPVINPNANPQPSAPKIVPLMKRDALLAEIENPASIPASSSSNQSKGMIDDKMAEKFISGKLKKITDNQTPRTDLEIRPSQTPMQQPKTDPYRENSN